MPLRFRKSFKILPGVKINLSKSGISTSLGGRGASVNIGKRGTRTTVGLPGTGLSYSSTSSSSKPRATKTQSPSPSHGSANSSTSGSGCLNGLLTLIALPFRVLGDLVKSFIDPTTRKSTSILIGVITGICILCFGATNVIGSDSGSKTPTPYVDINAIGTQAMINAWSVYTQTALALPSATFTETAPPLPTMTIPPLPTQTLAPTMTPIPTFTAVIYVPPTQAPPPASNHPVGTSGQCVDGSYTSAQHKQGACSHHGGVSQWWGP